MAPIALDHVEKVYSGGVKALDDLKLEVKGGRVHGARRAFRMRPDRSPRPRTQPHPAAGPGRTRAAARESPRSRGT
jgi:hypothetical protein